MAVGGVSAGSARAGGTTVVKGRDGAGAVVVMTGIAVATAED
jgi:hypothetical protein